MSLNLELSFFLMIRSRFCTLARKNRGDFVFLSLKYRFLKRLWGDDLGNKIVHLYVIEVCTLQKGSLPSSFNRLSHQSLGDRLAVCRLPFPALAVAEFSGFPGFSQS